MILSWITIFNRPKSVPRRFISDREKISEVAAKLQAMFAGGAASRPESVR